MRFLKLENGWKDLETGQFWEFGTYVLNIARFYHERLHDNSSKVDEFYRDLENKFGKEFAHSLDNEVSIFLGVLDDLIDCDSDNVFDFEIKDYLHDSKEEQIELHRKKVELIKKQGWKDFPDNKDINLFTFYLIKCADTSTENSLLPYEIYPHFINNKWYFSYEVGDTDRIMYLDLIELQQQNYNLAHCKCCDNIFIKKRKNQKYCSEKCQTVYKKIYEQDRKNSLQGLKHKVHNYMRNSKKFNENEINKFLQEFDSLKETMNESDLITWLNTKHQKFKDA